MIAIAASIIGTAGVGLLGWFFRGSLARLVEFTIDKPIVYSWFFAVFMVSAWLSMVVAGIDLGMTYKVITGMVVFLALIGSIRRD